MFQGKVRRAQEDTGLDLSPSASSFRESVRSRMHLTCVTAESTKARLTSAQSLSCLEFHIGLWESDVAFVLLALGPCLHVNPTCMRLCLHVTLSAYDHVCV